MVAKTVNQESKNIASRLNWKEVIAIALIGGFCSAVIELTSSVGYLTQLGYYTVADMFRGLDSWLATGAVGTCILIFFRRKISLSFLRWATSIATIAILFCTVKNFKDASPELPGWAWRGFLPLIDLSTMFLPGLAYLLISKRYKT